MGEALLEHPTPRRRAADPMIDHLHLCIENVKADVRELRASHDESRRELAENTKVTTEVRDILAAFKGSARIAKYFTIMAGAIAAGVELYRLFP